MNPDMRNPPRHDLGSIVRKAEAEHHAHAQASEAKWRDELEARRRALAAECARIVERIRCAS
jgi:hypothetical protein